MSKATELMHWLAEDMGADPVAELGDRLVCRIAGGVAVMYEVVGDTLRMQCMSGADRGESVDVGKASELIAQLDATGWLRRAGVGS